MARGEDTSSHPARSSFGDRVNDRLGNSLGSLYPKAGDTHRSLPSTGARGNAARGPMPVNTVPDASVALNARKADEARRAQGKADRASRPVGHIIPRETGGPQRVDPYNKRELGVALARGYEMQGRIGNTRTKAGVEVKTSSFDTHRKEAARIERTGDYAPGGKYEGQGGYKPNTKSSSKDDRDHNAGAAYNTTRPKFNGYSQGGPPFAQRHPYTDRKEGTGSEGGRTDPGAPRTSVGQPASPDFQRALEQRRPETRRESRVKGPSQISTGKYFHEAGMTGRGPIMPHGSVGEFFEMPEQASQLIDVNESVLKSMGSVMKPAGGRKPVVSKLKDKVTRTREGEVNESKVKGRKGKDGLKKPPTGPIKSEPIKVKRPAGAAYDLGSTISAPDMSAYPTSTHETASARIAEAARIAELQRKPGTSTAPESRPKKGEGILDPRKPDEAPKGKTSAPPKRIPYVSGDENDPASTAPKIRGKAASKRAPAKSAAKSTAKPAAKKTDASTYAEAERSKDAARLQAAMRGGKPAAKAPSKRSKKA